jgi:hypothetical protein
VDLELELELLPGLEKLLVLEKLLEREMDELLYTEAVLGELTIPSTYSLPLLCTCRTASSPRNG